MPRLLAVVARNTLQFWTHFSFGFVDKKIMKFVTNQYVLVKWNGPVLFHYDFGFSSDGPEPIAKLFCITYGC
jgi:hypothetical protein